ncbi:MAG TPA: M3 family metallopeptidase [Candidatus Eisenbacteria bacterium]|nr:M3 family metallopeptidase [Candidatus Eisenbacteria bacterium]
MSRGPEATADRADAPFWSDRPDADTFTRTMTARLERARALIGQIGRVTGPRTIENTLQPYDDAFLEAEAVSSQAGLIENVHPDAALRDAGEALSRVTAAFFTELSLDRGVYDALAALDLSGADPATRHYVTRTLRDFRLAGVDQDDATRERVRQLNEALVAISQEFSRNIRSDRRTVTATPEELEGLPPDVVARLTPAADGTVTLTTDYPDAMPVFAYARSEALRHRMYLEFNNRAFPVNVDVLRRMIATRHALATLLGFASWADYVTADKMARSARSASEFVDRIVEASGPRATAEFAQLLERKRRDVPDATGVNAWESVYWSEQLRRSDYGFDAQALRPYLPFARVQQGVLDVCGRLFGVRFQRVADAPVWHPSVQCFEVLEGDERLGRFYLDMHPRADKYNHAAQFDIRTGVAGRQLPEACLVCNFPGGVPGDPGLMEYADVRTFFHEFGHLLHTLFSGRQRWTGIGGIRTEQDFIEVPSQLLEEWTQDHPTLASFACHVETGEPLPEALVRQMVRAHEFGKGLGVRRQMVFARVSLSCFDRDPTQVEPDRIVEDTVRAYQPFPFVPGTHMTCAFGHLDGYSAGYYAYMWSLVIAKDFFGQFDRAHLMEPSVARRYRDTVLAAGGSAPAEELVQRFLGRPFGFEAWKAWLEETH